MKKEPKINENRVKVERSGHAKIVNPHIKHVQEFEKSIEEYSMELATLEHDFTSLNRSMSLLN